MAKKKRKQRPRKSRGRPKREPGEGVDFRYHTYFVGGKQKRYSEDLIEGVPVEEFIARNADEVF